MNQKLGPYSVVNSTGAIGSSEECIGGETAESKAAFFVQHGCIVVPRLFEGEHLARLQRVWRKAGEAARVQWEAAKVVQRARDGSAAAQQRAEQGTAPPHEPAVSESNSSHIS